MAEISLPATAGGDPQASERLSGRARYLLILSLIIAIADGYDIQSMSFAAPAVGREFGFAAASFGPIFSAGLFGAIIGAFGTAALSGKVDRKTQLVGSLVVISVFSLLTSYCTTVTQFMIVRLITNIGLGAAVPTLMALCCHYVPNRRRGMTVGLLYAGSPLGGVVAGFLASQFIPEFGWRSIFFTGGVVPALLCLVVLKTFPRESADPIALEGRGSDQASPARHPEKRATLFDLFAEGRTPMTLMTIVPFLLMPMLMALLSFWMPTLFERAGIDGSHAAIVTALFNAGAVAGAIMNGFLIDRYGPFILLPITAVLGVSFAASLGVFMDSPMLLAVLATAAGFFLASTAAGLLALPTKIYPTHLGPTGVTAAFAVAKSGQFIGPLIVSGLMTVGMRDSDIFSMTLVNGTVSATVLLILRAHLRARARRLVPAAE